MGEAFITRRGGGGGGGLNFRVIGGTTAPASPKENDIWVNTEEKVTGYIFASKVENLYEVELTSTKESTGQYINETGGIASNSSFAVSNYVELPENTRYITVYHGTAGSSTMYHAFYDADQNFISSVFRENKTLTYTVPSNAAYVRLSLCTMSTADSLTFTASVDDGSIAEGTVWIAVGTSSPAVFNAVKKNSIVVHPMSAKQYVEGFWIEKIAKSYQNEAWVDWLPGIALYWRGDECVDLTGGWTSKKWTMSSDAGTSEQTFEIARNADHLHFFKDGMIGAVMYAANPIDLTNVKAIHFKGEMNAGTNARWCAFYVWTKMGGSYWDTNAAAKVQCVANSITPSFTLDVSALSGSHYIGFGIYQKASYVKVEELYMEVEA